MDCSPVLLLSEESLTELRRRAGWEVPMDRFRPNLVVAGTSGPHAEDSWRRVRIGSVELQPVGLCARCQVTEVNQETGVPKDAPGSVLRALAGYRQREGSIYFGMYYRAVNPGALRVGDTVEILS